MYRVTPSHHDRGQRREAFRESYGRDVLSTPIARKHRVPYHPLQRHWRTHVDAERKARLLIGPVQKAALAARIAEENSSVIDSLKVVRAGLYETYDAALKAGDRFAVGTIAGRLHENLRIMASITGELASSPLVTIHNNQTNVALLTDSPAFASFAADLIRALSRFPEARSAVLAEFERLEGASARVPALEYHARGEEACA
jgi:hypothetical protein